MTITSEFCAFYRRALFVEQLLLIILQMNWNEYWAGTIQAAAQKLVRLKNNNSSINNIQRGTTSNNNSNNNDDDSATVIIQPEDEHLVLLGMPIQNLLHHLQTEILPLTSR